MRLIILKRLLKISALAVSLLVICWLFVMINTYIGDGLNNLHVKVTSASQMPIKGVRCQTTYQGSDEERKELEDTLLVHYKLTRDTTLWPLLASQNWQVAPELFRGEGFEVGVLFSEKWFQFFGFRWTQWYSQLRTLVVHVEYQSGEHAFKVVEIPDMKVSQSVSVVLP